MCRRCCSCFFSHSYAFFCFCGARNDHWFTVCKVCQSDGWMKQRGRYDFIFNRLISHESCARAMYEKRHRGKINYSMRRNVDDDVVGVAVRMCGLFTFFLLFRFIVKCYSFLSSVVVVVTRKCEYRLLSEWISKNRSPSRSWGARTHTHSRSVAFLFSLRCMLRSVLFCGRKFITHNINLHIKKMCCTSYLLMIRCKHFIKFDHKAIKYSPINAIYKMCG